MNNKFSQRDTHEGQSADFPPLEAPESDVSPIAEGPLIPSATDGRDANSGRFLANNRFGKGNPVSKQAHRLRRAMYAAVTPADLQEAIQALIGKAKEGSVPACKLLVEILLGPPQSLDTIRMICKLEKAVMKGALSGAEIHTD